VSDASKKARRDQAREHAREMREIERKRRRRNRLLVQGGVVLALIAIAAIVVLVVSSIQPKPAGPSAGPKNMLSDGILLTADATTSGDIVAVPTAAIPSKGKPTPTDVSKHADTVNIVTYIDYFCPVCQAFEQANQQQIGTWVSQGLATLEIHPISFLDRSSLGTRYATRAANAAACVANYQPDVYFQVNTAFYANQPAENTVGLSNDEIISLLTQAGATDSHIAKCVKDETFSKWVAAATTRVNDPLPNSNVAGVTGTPTVLVNGIQYTGQVNDTAGFSDFVTSIANGTYVAP
jgi:protein-disulfide isomerase